MRVGSFVYIMGLISQTKILERGDVDLKESLIKT